MTDLARSQPLRLPTTGQLGVGYDLGGRSRRTSHTNSSQELAEYWYSYPQPTEPGEESNAGLSEDAFRAARTRC